MGERHLFEELEGIAKSSCYGDELFACALAAYDAGNRIKRHDLPEHVVVKDDAFVGSHAITVESDNASQEIIFATVSRILPEAFLLAEEEDARFAAYAGRMLTSSNYLDKINERIIIADPMCGSAQYERRTGQWVVSVGLLDGMRHVAGAVYAPFAGETHDALFVAAEDTPAYAITDKTGKPVPINAAPDTTPMNRRNVYFGMDVPFLGYARFLERYASENRTANTHGSCGFPMALVALGDNDVGINGTETFTQCVQYPWDWAAGYRLIASAGGHVQFYEVDGLVAKGGKVEAYGEIKPTELKPQHYDPSRKSVGFIAGNTRDTVDYWMDVLLETYGK